MTHWYTQEGEPMYTVIGKNGKERNTTLRDARKLNLAPSVTGIIDILNKPALTRWKLVQALDMAQKFPRCEDEPQEDYVNRILQLSREDVDELAAMGNEMHEDVERYYKGLTVRQHRKSVEAVVEILKDLCGDVAWYAEHSFAAGDFGGKIDLLALEGAGIVVDLKTKDFDVTDDPKKLFWDEMDMQLSAYAMGVNKPGARRINIAMSRTVPGLVVAHEWDNSDYRQWRIFESLLHAWQDIKQYTPSIAKLKVPQEG